MKYHISFDIDLKRNKEKGIYIAFEGIDASGKETQAELLQKYLAEKGKRIVMTTEPNDNLMVGKFVRDILNHRVQMPSEALQYLFTADRVVNYHTIVIPALKEGNIVISHRVFWSAVPYGLIDKGLSYSNKEQILIAQSILSMYHGFVVPDITFYLDISVDTALNRLSNVKRKLEIYEKREKLVHIQRAYKMLIKEFKKEFVVINGEQKPDKVFDDIKKYINKKLKIK